MKIVLITLCKNEQFILPFFLRHYEKFVDEIHIHDNQSTDGSIEIIKLHPKCIFYSYDTGGTMCDIVHTEIKNNFYKRLEADWFIIVDIDEFVYHPDIRQVLQDYLNNGITIPQIKGYGMVSDKLPINDGTQIYDQIKEGMPYSNYDKKAIFYQSVDINYESGCHRCRPYGRVIYSKDCVIKLLHFKMLSKEYVVERSKKIVLSSMNVRKKWGIEAAAPAIMLMEWQVHWNKKQKVIE